MNNISNFYTRLKNLRVRNNFVQKDLAEKLGLAQTTIANYEKGKRFPDEEILLKIADIFNISLDYLLGRSEIYSCNEDFTQRDSIQPSKNLIDPSILTLKNEYLDALISGELQVARTLILNAVCNDLIDVKRLYTEIFKPSLIQIGEMWDMNIIDVYQEHYFSNSTQSIMSQLYPYFHCSTKKSFSCISLSASGDSHNMGIQMVTDFFEMDGWDTYFLGSHVPTQSVLKAIKDRKTDIIIISCTISSYIDSLKCLIMAIRNLKGSNDVKIMVGGRAFNAYNNLWKSVGADGFSANAEEAVKMANEFMINRYFTIK